MRKYKEKRYFRDLETGTIYVIYIRKYGVSKFNGRFYMSYKTARARLTKISSGKLVRIEPE